MPATVHQASTVSGTLAFGCPVLASCITQNLEISQEVETQLGRDEQNGIIAVAIPEAKSQNISGEALYTGTEFDLGSAVSITGFTPIGSIIMTQTNISYTNSDFAKIGFEAIAIENIDITP